MASPCGNGDDCHRTWEALLLGCIPIVEKSPVNELFIDLPVICIENWGILTRSFLQKKVRELQKRPFNQEKLYADYWFNCIRSDQKRCRRS